MAKTWKERLSWLWNEWGKSLLVVLLVVGGFRSAIADWNDVPTGSMKPTILEGDRIVVNKLAYDLKVPFTSWRLVALGVTPKRGDDRRAVLAQRRQAAGQARRRRCRATASSSATTDSSSTTGRCAYEPLPEG